MGIFSSDRTTTNQTTQNIDNRVGADANGFAVGHESNVNIDNVPDAAFDLLARTFDTQAESIYKIASVFSDTFKDSLSSVQQGTNTIIKSANDASLNAIQAADTFTRNDTAKLSEKLAQSAPLIIFILVGGYVAIKYWGK